jgi:hypothetical protein
MEFSFYIHSTRCGWGTVHATSWKVADSSPDEVITFFSSIYMILPAAISPGVYSASNRNKFRKQKNNVSGE